MTSGRRGNRGPKLRPPAGTQKLFAERRLLGPSFQEPPRNTRREQSPDRLALPSAGASA